MKVWDFVLILLIIALLGGAYYFWNEIKKDKINYQGFSADLTAGIDSNKMQFYPNMRFTDRTISYSFADKCRASKRSDVREAFSILDSKTDLSFVEKNGGEISILCSEISPLPEEEGHFVAGEGGPTKIINTTRYSVILAAKVSLYRDEKCETPNVAIHEILHALGFDHQASEESIMYPIADCKQQIPESIINEINSLYKMDKKTDLAIASVSANRSRLYLNFDIAITNIGLDESGKAELMIYSNGELAKTFDEVGALDIGVVKSLSVQNLRIPYKFGNITFVVSGEKQEITLENNKAVLVLPTE